MNQSDLLNTFAAADATEEPGLVEQIPTMEPAQGPADIALRVDMVDLLPDQLVPGWQFLQTYPLMAAFLVVCTGYLLGKLFQYLNHRLLGRMASLSKSHLDDHLVRMLNAPIMHTMMLLSLVLAVHLLNLPETLDMITIRLLMTILVLSWARALLSSTPLILAELKNNRNRFPLFQPRSVPLIQMGINLLLFGLLVYLCFSLWGIDATAWLASAGIIGIAVGFAAKDTLANLISGVSIIADKPYKIGDYIVLDTGERGVVTSLGIRSTRLLTRDDLEISIPNAVIGTAKITNESGGPWLKQRIRVPVGVAYGSETEKVVTILEGIAKSNADIVENPEARVRMRGFGDNALNFELLGWIEKPELRGLVRHNILLEIDRRFREEGIKIPFPQREIHIQKNESGSDDN
jgi:MscS family membrane protein